MTFVGTEDGGFKKEKTIVCVLLMNSQVTTF